MKIIKKTFEEINEELRGRFDLLLNERSKYESIELLDGVLFMKTWMHGMSLNGEPVTNYWGEEFSIEGCELVQLVPSPRQGDLEIYFKPKENGDNETKK